MADRRIDSPWIFGQFAFGGWGVVVEWRILGEVVGGPVFAMAGWWLLGGWIVGVVDAPWIRCGGRIGGFGLGKSEDRERECVERA